MIKHVNLSTVLNALVTIIIKYHDYQNVRKIVETPSPEAVHQKAEELLKELNATELNDRLTSYIEECTSDVGYSTRKPFLNYMLMQINYLKPIIARDRAMDENEILRISSVLKQLFLDSIELLKTTKEKTYKVTWKDCKIDINGLSNSAFYAISLCNSGQLLLNELFAPLNLCDKSNASEIEATLLQLLNEFNLPLLAQEAISLKKENTSLQAQNADQSHKIDSLKQEIARLRHILADENKTDPEGNVYDSEEHQVARPPTRQTSRFPSFFPNVYPVGFLAPSAPSHARSNSGPSTPFR